MKDTRKSAKRSAGRGTPSQGLTAEERAALKETVQERLVVLIIRLGHRREVYRTR